MRRYMTVALICASVLAVFPPMSSVHAGGVDIGRHLSRHHMLFVLAPTATDADYMRQQALFTGQADELAAHEIVVGLLTDDAGGTFAGDMPMAEQAIGMRNYFLVAPGKFVVALLSKDGTYEMMRVEPITVDALFAVVDALPT